MTPPCAIESAPKYQSTLGFVPQVLKCASMLRGVWEGLHFNRTHSISLRVTFRMNAVIRGYTRDFLFSVFGSPQPRFFQNAVICKV